MVPRVTCTARTRQAGNAAVMGRWCTATEDINGKVWGVLLCCVENLRVTLRVSTTGQTPRREWAASGQLTARTAIAHKKTPFPSWERG